MRTMAQWFEHVLSKIAPPKMGSLNKYQDFQIENADPFGSELREDGVGLVMYDVRCTGIEKARFEEGR